MQADTDASGDAPARTAVGPSIAPLFGAALAWADTERHVGLGSLRPAPDRGRRPA